MKGSRWFGLGSFLVSIFCRKLIFQLSSSVYSQVSLASQSFFSWSSGGCSKSLLLMVIRKPSSHTVLWITFLLWVITQSMWIYMFDFVSQIVTALTVGSPCSFLIYLHQCVCVHVCTFPWFLILKDVPHHLGYSPSHS